MSAAPRSVDRGPHQAPTKDDDGAVAEQRPQQRRAGNLHDSASLSMQPAEIFSRAKEKFGDRVLEITDQKPDPWMVVSPPAIVEVCQFLKDDPATSFDCL